MKHDYSPGAHLILQEHAVPAGGEWTARLAGWTVLHVQNGTGYYLQSQLNQELSTGSVLLVAGGVNGTLRASQLNELALNVFSVIPARLTGLVTLPEQSAFDLAAARIQNGIRCFSPASPVAAKMAALGDNQNREGLSFRLKLLQIFVEAAGNDEPEKPEPDKPAAGDLADATKRLQVLLKQTPAAELLEMSFDELARLTRCTTRHLSRVFHELVGMSFREKRAELRLARARELLATSDAKVVDVALESGYKSLSLFNLMFARRYGISPGKWRKKHGAQKKLVQVYFQRGRGYKN